MASNPLDTQVVIVGAGPVGLLLAGELRLGGAQVTVLERLAAPTGESRASTLHARTAEMFDQRGLLARFAPLRGGGPGHFGGIPLELSGVDSPYAGQWKVPQADIERELEDWARGLGADIRRRHTLRALDRAPGHLLAEADGPHGTVRLHASYLVGCDGEQSLVRKLSGFPFPGSDATRLLLRADVAGLDIPDRRFERHGDGLAISSRRPDGVTRVMVHEFGKHPGPQDRAPSYDEVAAAWKRVTGDDITGGTPVWVNAFGDCRRQVAQYRRGRVLLAGDAAHAQMPVGGQALNLGLQDAANLGWKLAAQVRGTAPDGLLDSYHDERHAVGDRVLGSIAAQTSLLLGGAETDALRSVLGELLPLVPATRHLADAVAGLAVRYPAGPGDGPEVGARIPPRALKVRAEPSSTTALLREGKGVLLDLRNDTALHTALLDESRPWADRVSAVAAVCVDDGTPPLDGVWLVRPDGYVAWRGPAELDLPRPGLSGHELPEHGLRAALHRFFGTPHMT